MAVATEAESERQSGGNRTMGRKYTLPYGLYRTHGFISAHLARQTRFSDDDLMLLWESLLNMFEHDRSAARGQMTTRGLYVFKHASALGQAPAHSLFERIQTQPSNGVMREFSNFSVTVKDQDLPDGVSLQRLMG
jgi:CRISPR-associated protein Csd2